MATHYCLLDYPDKVGDSIGSDSPLGNPFIDEQNPISRYESWLRDQLKTRNIVTRMITRFVTAEKQEQSVVLVCTCPVPFCHGPVVKALIEELAAEE